jgi:hypothetical protein
MARLDEELKTLKKKSMPEINEVLSRMEAKLNNRTDELEQYQRLNNLRFFGIPEKSGESPADIVVSVAHKIDVQLKREDIECCYRAGRSLNGKPRPIVCRLNSYSKRSELFGSKRKLSGQPTTIREDLTRARMVVLNHAISQFGLANVWTSDGAICVHDGKKRYRVSTMEQLREIKRSSPS